MNSAQRHYLVTAFNESRKNLLNPVENIIWELTKNFDSQTEFRMAVNLLFRHDCKKADDRALFEKALQSFYKKKAEVNGMEYILTINELFSKKVNDKY